MAWQKTTGYGRRSRAETAMFRYKALIGSSLRARTLPAQKMPAQKTETKVGCSVLNRMARLGMPASQRVRRKFLGLGLYVHDLNYAPKPDTTALP